MNTLVDEILKGSYDLHVHAAPDANQERRLDAIETARVAYEAEMGGFVLKSHEYVTAPLTYALNQMYPGLDVIGSVTLNRAMGGLNPDAVETAAKLDARVVWMPTFTADHWLKNLGRGPGISLFDDDDKLKPEVLDVLDLISQYDMVLASGHVSPAEALALFQEAKSRGVRRMIATHPHGVASRDEQREMASLGAYLEYTFLACMPSRGTMTPKELVGTIQSLGVNSCILTTDFGQWMNPPPAEGMRMAISALLDAGMKSEDVSMLVKENPIELLGVG
ncbi:MAG: hypothetical protein IIB14_02115 [Chloroflexi bacterium]|nr:hypothetical protein [Chloroflexota bacterium]